MGRIADWLNDIEEILDITLFNKWLWIIICGMCTVVILPLFIIAVILSVPPWLGATAIILIIIGWSIAGGYKEYSLYKRKSEQVKLTGEKSPPYVYDEYYERYKRKYRP
jgi:hypothetical protein